MAQDFGLTWDFSALQWCAKSHTHPVETILQILQAGNLLEDSPSDAGQQL